jgi:hypothetical protein
MHPIDLRLKLLALSAPGGPELDEGGLPGLDVIRELDGVSVQVFKGSPGGVAPHRKGLRKIA